MFEKGRARTIDISNLVRLRKHLSWSSQFVAGLGVFGVMAFGTPELRDWVYIGAVGVLAWVTYLVLYMGWVAAIPPLAISLVTLTTVLTARFVAASMPIDTKDEWGLLIAGIAGVATALWVLALWLAPFARAARRSPYLKLMFATNRRL